MFSFINKHKQDIEPEMIHDLVGCFGKLPVHGDFIKYNLKVREAVELDEWIQDGVTLLNRRYEDKWKKAFHLMPGYRFVFSGGNDTKTITGVISPSHDKTGRDYPFVLFRACNITATSGAHSVQPVLFSELYKKHDTMIRQDWAQQSLELFTSEIDSTSAFVAVSDDDSITETITQFLSNTTLQTFWDAILPGADDETRELFIHLFLENLKTVERRSPQRVPWGVRVPLPGNDMSENYVMFFVRMAEQYLAGRNWRPFYIWNEGVPGIPPRLMIFFRPIPASYFTLFIDPRRTEDMVSDVLSEIELCDPAMLESSGLMLEGDMSLQQVIDNMKQPVGVT